MDTHKVKIIVNFICECFLIHSFNDQKTPKRHVLQLIETTNKQKKRRQNQQPNATISVDTRNIEEINRNKIKEYKTIKGKILPHILFFLFLFQIQLKKLIPVILTSTTRICSQLKLEECMNKYNLLLESFDRSSLINQKRSQKLLKKYKTQSKKTYNAKTRTFKEN